MFSWASVSHSVYIGVGISCNSPFWKVGISAKKSLRGGRYLWSQVCSGGEVSGDRYPGVGIQVVISGG